jgi:hypothetical protein
MHFQMGIVNLTLDGHKDEVCPRKALLSAMRMKNSRGRCTPLSAGGGCENISIRSPLSLKLLDFSMYFSLKYHFLFA